MVTLRRRDCWPTVLVNTVASVRVETARVGAENASVAVTRENVDAAAGASAGGDSGMRTVRSGSGGSTSSVPSPAP